MKSLHVFQIETFGIPNGLAEYRGWMLSLQSAKTYRMYIGWEEYPRDLHLEVVLELKTQIRLA